MCTPTNRTPRKMPIPLFLCAAYQHCQGQLNSDLLPLLSARELCRKHAISDATFYTWRKKYGGAEVKRLKLLAEAMLDKEALQVALGQKY